MCEDKSVVSAVRELDNLVIARKHDGVVTYDIAAADYVNAYLIAALADHALTSVHLFAVADLLFDDTEDCLCRAARRILLEVMVRLDNLDIVIGELFCRFPNQVEEDVDSQTVVA